MRAIWKAVGGENIDNRELVRRSELSTPWTDELVMLDAIREAPHYIQRWRAQMCGDGDRTEGMPMEPGMKSKPPFQVDNMSNGDEYAVRLARLAIFAANKDIIPEIKIRGMLWHGGKPVGLKPVYDGDEFDLLGEHTGVDVYAPLMEWVSTLGGCVPQLVRHAEAHSRLKDVYRLWQASMRHLNRPEKKWLTRDEVVEKYGVAARTVDDWGDCGIIETLSDYGERLFEEGQIKVYIDQCKESKYQAGLRNIRRALQAKNGIVAGQ